ncbi:MAG: hypothetical protein HY736_07375 [Verrucomicrobia bacterium]|nr:hypothetical protein [Verrucomicrobiota bacterium]
MKIHRHEKAYFRERTIYQRLMEHGVNVILGFSVPQLLGWNDDCLAIELTVVSRPFVLDFAGARLDEPPEFSEEVWQDWESEKREQFEGRWPEVQAVLAELRTHGVFMLDVTPTNIAFRK